MAEKEKTPENIDTYKEPSKDQIAAWKKKHDTQNITVFKASDKRDDSVKKAFFRDATLVDLQRASASEKAKAGTFNQSLFENLLLDCHPDVRTNQSLLIGIITQMGELNTAAEVIIEKL